MTKRQVVDSRRSGVEPASFDQLSESILREHGMVLARTIRHNLRNRLTTIKGNAERIATVATGVEKEASEVIIQEADRLIEMAHKELVITNILKQQPDLTAVSLPEIIERSVESFRDDVPCATIQVEQSAVPEARGIPEIEYAIEELIHNAIVHNPNDQPSVRLEIREDTAECQIRVLDDSTVIPESERSVIQNTELKDQLTHSNGIGLCMVRWIVDCCDGELSFDRSEMGGNAVSITLQKYLPR